MLWYNKGAVSSLDMEKQKHRGEKLYLFEVIGK